MPVAAISVPFLLSQTPRAGEIRPIFVMTNLNFIVIWTVTAPLAGLAILLPLPNDASDFRTQFTSNALAEPSNHSA
jgi:hypothetical protein